MEMEKELLDLKFKFSVALVDKIFFNIVTYLVNEI
jgi:hypothetical protein